MRGSQEPEGAPGLELEEERGQGPPEGHEQEPGEERVLEPREGQVVRGKGRHREGHGSDAVLPGLEEQRWALRLGALARC